MLTLTSDDPRRMIIFIHGRFGNLKQRLGSGQQIIWIDPFLKRGRVNQFPLGHRIWDLGDLWQGKGPLNSGRLPEERKSNRQLCQSHSECVQNIEYRVLRREQKEQQSPLLRCVSTPDGGLSLFRPANRQRFP